MESLFNTETQQAILNRIDSLSESTQANWGKMNVSQMLKHCQLPLETATKKREMNIKAGVFKRFLFKNFIKPHMYNDKLWKQNVQTPKEFVINDTKAFVDEKANLVNLINEFSAKKNETNWPTHPLFGDFTPEQRGKMQYKHIDHHLRQFGV